MAMWVPNALAVKGAKDAFHQRIDQIPEVWKNYATITDSTTATETYAYAEAVPPPRIMTGERQIQGMTDANFTVTNDTHELTLLVRREAFEDDQVSGINSRFREMAEVYTTFKDKQFTDLLENGSSTTLGLAPIDNLAFFHDTRTINGSGTIDNDLTAAAAAATGIPTTAEFLIQLAAWKAAMLRYTDSKGRPFNMLASTKMRIAVMPEAEAIVKIALNSAFLPVVAADGASDVTNVFQGMAEIDVLPYHAASTDTNTMYLAMVGAERKPILYQQRMPLEVIVDMDPTNIAERNGVLVMCRERYKMTYGDPRRMLKFVWT
jgi:phage major head subunit gpT-like protein